MAKRTVRHQWGPVPGRRQMQGKGTDLIQPDETDQSFNAVSEDVENNEPVEKLGTPKPDESFSNRPAYCSTVGKTGKRYKGGGL